MGPFTHELLSADYFNTAGDNPDKSAFLTLLDAIQESILIVDQQGIVCYVNRAYCKLFKISRNHLLGKPLADFEPLARIHDVLKHKTLLHSDVSHINASNIDVVANISPLIFNGELAGAIATIQNISELNEMERQLKHFKALSSHLQTRLQEKENLPPRFQAISGNSPKFNQLLHLASRVAPTDASVFISGESGVGKEVLSNAIHYSSSRSSGPFVALNCAAIPESLLESELFGYEKGAFTGAKTEGRKGKFEQANGGTIFLDEIGDMDLKMQVKLLRVLQEKEFERVGGSRLIKVDFRLISATNKDLEKMIEEGSFREDLFYRINIIPLTIPPLRERMEDIPILCDKFMAEMNEKYARKTALSMEVLETLSAYHWPGNIRELKNIIEQLVILCPENMITSEYLPQKIQSARCSLPNKGSLKSVMGQTEKEMIIAALKETNNNKTQAMKLLGISRRTFYQKLEKYNLK